jgi:predicted flap endonuclease-1-like 5' DNA nuclease
MNSTTIIAIAVIVVIALLFLFLVRGRKQHVSLGDMPPLARPAPPSPAAPSAESHDVGTEICDAIEDVVDQFVGIRSHPTDAPKGPGDTLTLLKGLGPKAATLLYDMGVTRFEQIARWNDADVAAIDARMGAFKGRIVRDRWVAQAKLLAKDDTETFEAEFGKLGG